VRATGAARRAGLAVYVVTVTVLFSLSTGPGPFLHTLVAGASTPVARLATDVFGQDQAVANRNVHVLAGSPVTSGLLQILLGLPVYAFFTWLALRLVRGAIRHSRRSVGPNAELQPRLAAQFHQSVRFSHPLAKGGSAFSHPSGSGPRRRHRVSSR